MYLKKYKILEQITVIFDNRTNLMDNWAKISYEMICLYSCVKLRVIVAEWIY